MTLLTPTPSVTTESYYWTLVAGLLLFALLSVTDVLAYTMESGAHGRGSETALSENAHSYKDMGLKYTKPSGEVKVEMPLDTQVTMTVSGMINRVTVRQIFSNPTSDWLDGEYRFPLPTNAAVDGLTMKLGDRLVKGVIQPKAQARRTFAKAKASGRKASLLEQQRPNIFITSVANLAPNEKLVVEITYQEVVSYDAGRYSLRYPMTITPRYHPLSTKGLQSGGNGSRSMPLPEFKTDPEYAHGISLDVLLKPGFAIDTLDSPYHKVSVEPASGDCYRVTLQSGYVANKDFMLSWQAEDLSRPNAALFTQVGLTHKKEQALQLRANEQVKEAKTQWSDSQGRVRSAAIKANSVEASTLEDQEAFGLLMFSPPELEEGEENKLQTIPRELTLVIDTSGSMSGESIAQAKSAVLSMLKTLTSCEQKEATGLRCDSFNLLAFNHKTRGLFSQAKVMNEFNLAKASEFISGLEAEGGTEMMSALIKALPVDTESQEDSQTEHRLKQVIFITDGAVGNEKALFNAIADRLGEHRLFTVGIGSAPNSHFMERAAQLGRGSFTYIGKVSEVKQKMDALSGKIARPALTDIVVTYSDGTVPDYWPATIPDLYQGEPLMLAIKMNRDEQRDLWLSASIAGQAWHRQLSTTELTSPLAESTQILGSGLDLVWARKQVAHLELNKRPMTASKIKQQVIGLSMKYHFMSPYTSLVAVDMGQTAKTSMQLGQDKRQGRVTPHRSAGQSLGQTLPQTASWSQFYLYGGVGLMIMSLLLFALSIAIGSRRNSLAY